MSTVAAGTAPAAAQDARQMPLGLIEELAELLAQALVADLREYPNLAALKAEEAATVVSPRGPDRAACRHEGRSPDQRPRRKSATRPRVAPSAARDGPDKVPQ